MTPPVERLFPETIKQYRCPHCGMILDGLNYNIDASKLKCTKRWHRGIAVSMAYVKAPDQRAQVAA